MLCEYGCGQEAIYQFKNGKWCCSASPNSCLVIRRKKSNSLKGVYVGKLNSSYGKTAWNRGISHNLETRKKMSKSHKGVPLSQQHKKRISNSKKNISEDIRKKISDSQKGKIISEKQKKKISISKRFNIKDIKKKYSKFSSIESMRYNPSKPGEKEIQVHCKNNKCKNSKEKGGWFTPTRGQWYGRIYAIEKYCNNIENNFYCSERCKIECDYFNNKKRQLGKMRSKWFKGDGNPNWKGGISCEPYCEQWLDKDYLESIKIRDGYKCLNPYCYRKTELLCIHHINYVKKDCHPLNLITLCISCNSYANTDRDWHETWYKAIIFNRYIRRYKCLNLN